MYDIEHEVLAIVITLISLGNNGIEAFAFLLLLAGWLAYMVTEAYGRRDE